MDEFSRSAKYEYRANSNLVLEADRKGGRKSEPSGEATSLWGTSIKMGDRVAAGRPAEVAARKEADAKKRRRADPIEAVGLGEYGSKQRRRAAGGGRLGDLGAVEAAGYRPRTRETQALWEQVLREAQASLGDQPQEILCGAAEEVLAALKDDSLREPQKKARIESMLGPLADDTFGRLLQVSKGINDFTAAGSGGGGDAGAGGGLDEDIGVAVVFDDEDDEDEGNDAAVVQEEEDEEEDDDAGVEAAVGSGLAAEHAEGGDDAGDEADEVTRGLVPVHRIDAYWLQRELAKYFDDATVAQARADEVLAILGSGMAGGGNGGADSRRADMREVETRLVSLLDYDKFDLVKLLLRNAARVYYVTRLKQAQTDAERAAVRAAMEGDTAAG